jgi:hypothetical protein
MQFNEYGPNKRQPQAGQVPIHAECQVRARGVSAGELHDKHNVIGNNITNSTFIIIIIIPASLVIMPVFAVLVFQYLSYVSTIFS